MAFVTYKGKKFEIVGKGLALGKKNISDITDLKGLENLTNLNRLYLNDNQISEIKGLENLPNLETLLIYNNQITEIKGLENLVNLKYLDLHGNQITEIIGLENLVNLKDLGLSKNRITEIKGLGNLVNLKYLTLRNNQIPQKILTQLGGLSNDGSVNNPQKFVEYCRLEKEEVDRFEQRVESLEEKFKIQIPKKPLEEEKIKEMMEVSDRLKLDMMRKALEIDEGVFSKNIFKWAKKFGFRIDGDYLIVNKDTITDFINMLDKQFALWEKGKDKIE